MDLKSLNYLRIATMMTLMIKFHLVLEQCLWLIE